MPLQVRAAPHIDDLIKSLAMRPPVLPPMAPNPAIVAALKAITKSFRIAPDLASYFQAENARLQRYEPKARILGRSGWTLPMRLPAAAVPDILEGIEEGVDYDEDFAELYSRREQRLLKEVTNDIEARAELAPWRKLLLECLDAYQRDHFQVAVPALLVVFEGMLAEVTATVLTSKDPKGAVAKRRAQSTRGFERLMWASIDGFTTELYKSVRFSSPRPRLTNRHWVQHGRDRAGWRRVDVIRLVHAIDTLACDLPRHSR